MIGLNGALTTRR